MKIITEMKGQSIIEGDTVSKERVLARGEYVRRNSEEGTEWSPIGYITLQLLFSIKSCIDEQWIHYSQEKKATNKYQLAQRNSEKKEGKRRKRF